MIELRIPIWTGVCNVRGKQILGLGNDIYQIGVAILDGAEIGAARVTFNEADTQRKSEHGVDGIIDLFPALKDGILLKDGEVSEVRTPTLISRHWQMAEFHSSLLRFALTGFFKPYIDDYLNNDNTYKDLLVIHLRGGDALDEWAQNEWRPSPLTYDFYQDAIDKSGISNVLIVTTPPENGRMHPLVEKLKADYNADVQHGTIVEDFSVLINCANLILNFSTFGYTAALMNTNLEKVFISRFVDKKGNSLLEDIASDKGFTMPEIENCDVYVYDYPEYVLKSAVAK
jgi:hypothetical protein